MTTHDTEDFFGPVKTPEQMAAEFIAARDRAAVVVKAVPVDPLPQDAPTEDPEGPAGLGRVATDRSGAGIEGPEATPADTPTEQSLGEPDRSEYALPFEATDDVTTADDDEELDVADPDYLANPSPELLAAAAVWFDEPIGRHAKKADDAPSPDESESELITQGGFFDDEPDRRFFGRRRSRD